MPPRTIDDLGPEVSIRYAEDQKNLDPAIIRESSSVPLQAEIDVTIPSFASEFDQLLEITKCNLPWASFYAPPRYQEQKKRVFRYRLIPSLGSEEKQENQLHKIQALSSQDTDQEDSSWQHKKSQQEEEEEKQTLTSLFHHLSDLDRQLLEISSRKSQYQKG